MSSLLRLERKQKNYSNSFRIRRFLFRSYSYLSWMSGIIHFHKENIKIDIIRESDVERRSVRVSNSNRVA